MISSLLATIETEEEYHAIDQIFRLYHKKMLAIALAVVHNQADAEDAVMTTVKYMCDHPQRFLDYESSKTIGLIYTKTKWTAIDIFRKNQKNSERLAALCENMESSACDTTKEDLLDVLINAENKELLHKALRSLSLDYQIPIVLKYFHQMKSHEIAEFMGLTEDAVDVRIHRGKSMLKERCISMGYIK